MKDTGATTVRRNISLSKTLDRKVNAKARRAGIPYNEYVRHVLLKDAETLIIDDWGTVPDEVMNRWDIETTATLDKLNRGEIKGYDNVNDLMNELDSDETENNQTNP